MRWDSVLDREIKDDRLKERDTACCIRKDRSGCVQSPKSECSKINDPNGADVPPRSKWVSLASYIRLGSNSTCFVFCSGVQRNGIHSTRQNTVEVRAQCAAWIHSKFLLSSFLVKAQSVLHNLFAFSYRHIPQKFGLICKLTDCGCCLAFPSSPGVSFHLHLDASSYLVLSPIIIMYYDNANRKM